MFKHRPFIWGICFLLAVLVVSPVAAAPAVANSITVNGRAEAAVNPDIAYITTGVVTVGNDVETAQKENNKIMRRVSEALAKQNIPSEQIQTTNFSIQPIYDYNNSQSEREITGYRVQNTVTVATTELEGLGSLLDAAASAGANQFQNIRFGLKDEAALQEKLLQQAARDGKKKAQLIAAAVGSTVGQPLAITENGQMAPILYENRQLAFKADTAGSTPITPGLITASVDLQLVFALQN